MSDRKIHGYCPMGCGETLFIGDGGWVTCGYLDYPNPTALTDIIMDRETEHIVLLEPTTFSVQHPLRERLNGDLFTCDLHQRLSRMDGPPVPSGRYRVLIGDRLHWTAAS